MTPPTLVRAMSLLFLAGTMAITTVTAQGAAPLPRPKPSLSSADAAADPDTTASIAKPGLSGDAFGDVQGLRTALSAISTSGPAALALAEDLPPLERDIVLWVAIRRDAAGLTPRQITEFAARNPHWPSATLMRQRAERVVARGRASDEDIVRAFSGGAVTEEGTLALARALIALDRKADATRTLAGWWASAKLSPAEESAAIKEFGDVLTRDQHLARYEMLMVADRVAQAAALAKVLGPEWIELAEARGAMLRGAKDAEKRLKAVSGDALNSPMHAYTLAEWHRRAGRPKEAAKALLSVPVDRTAAEGDAWWIERRIISRDLLEDGDAATAYALAAGHRGGDAETLAEARFHAGWYALRFLKDPAKAELHFKALQEGVSMPLSRSRAAYWLGRTAEAAGRADDARQHYEIAAADEFTYYGQLARVKLSQDKLDMPPVPEPTDADRQAFAQNDLVRALVLLTDADRPGDAAPLFTALAHHLPSGGQLVLLAEFAERMGNHRAALQVGKVAADRGLGAERLAFPLNSIPESARRQTEVETAMVYAIARQESAFDPAAVSHAGAMGLLQLLPSTAQATARRMGVSFERSKLTTDAAYNAKLGAAHLRELVEEFNGSYILTFAAYNAGSSRAYQWIERFGDPRDPSVDPVDWVESIPFGETRNYVQRVLENVQVYRERLSEAPLGIAEDLRRGS